MGFQEAFFSLKEIFPQIDARILRAVALEHKDVGDAVDAVLSHVIPFLSSKDVKLSDSTEVSVAESSQDVAASVSTLASASSSLLVEEPSEDAITVLPAMPETSTALPVDLSDGKLSEDATLPISETKDPFVASPAVVYLGDHDDSGIPNAPVYDVENGHYVKETLHEEGICSDEKKWKALGITVVENDEVDKSVPPKLFPESSNEMVFENIPHQNLQSHPDGGGVDEQKGISLEEVILDANLSMKLEETPSKLSVPVEELEASSSSLALGQQSSMSSSLSQSTQKHTIEVIEDLIDDAKNNKKELSSGMVFVRTLMEEVELKEKAAEAARANAAIALTDALARAEELKRMVQRAEEEKCTYAGEVYGEKAIQATEMKELHLRVLSLSDERNKSLSLLEEITNALHARLAAAENKIISAVSEKEEKEKAAMETCAEHVSALYKVKEEMKMLEQLSEENAKVHEFLLDRGRVVDALQGEIAVAYQDAKQLKEKLDQNVPLSKLLSSSQVCYNVPASSPSSPLLIEHEQLMETEDGWEIFEMPNPRNAAPELAC